MIWLLLLVLGMLAAGAPTASAGPSDCAGVDENGDIHITPGRCEDSIKEFLENQCRWLFDNPELPHRECFVQSS